MRSIWGVFGMWEGPDGRLTVSVGRREFEQLHREWADYVAANNAGSSPVDPLIALRSTGRVLRSLDRLLASMDRPEDNKDPSAAGAEHRE
jgi:hypothetical protein